MEWTPDRIRALADAMERRLHRPLVAVTPDTLRLVIEALRFFAWHAFQERREGYTVEMSDHRRGTVGERVGVVAQLDAAVLLYDWVVASRPSAHVTICKGGWVVRHAYPSDPILPAPDDHPGV